MPRVVVADAQCRAMVGDVGELEVDADNVRRMIAALDHRFPGLGPYIDKRMAIAIDGEIHHDAGAVPLTPASEVYLIPKIGGG